MLYHNDRIVRSDAERGLFVKSGKAGAYGLANAKPDLTLNRAVVHDGGTPLKRYTCDARSRVCTEVSDDEDW